LASKILGINDYIYIINFSMNLWFPNLNLPVPFYPKSWGWYLDPSSTISSPELDGMANDIFVHIADCIGTQPQVGTREGRGSGKNAPLTNQLVAKNEPSL
jgi:hypothetical protein